MLPTASRLKSHLPKILLRRGRIFCLCPARVLQTPYKAPLTTGKKPGRVLLQPNPLKKPLAAESYYAHWLRSSWSTWPMMTTMQASAHSWQVTAGSCWLTGLVLPVKFTLPASASSIRIAVQLQACCWPWLAGCLVLSRLLFLLCRLTSNGKAWQTQLKALGRMTCRT